MIEVQWIMARLCQVSCFRTSMLGRMRRRLLQRSAVDVSAAGACIPKVKADWRAKSLIGVIEAKRASASRWAWILRAVLSYS